MLALPRRRLKIGIIASIAERIPPKKYGGTERVIYYLVEYLMRRGHDVTLFASGDSKTSAKLVSLYPYSLREKNITDPYGINEQALLHIGSSYLQAGNFDIIHDHSYLISLPVAQFCPKPVVMTIHGQISNKNIQLFQTFTKPYYITISHSQTTNYPSFPKYQVIPNGLAMDDFPFSAIPGNYLLTVGRISKEKGTHLAVKVAKLLNMPLIIAAKLDKQEKEYFNRYIKPELNGNIVWLGEVDQQKRNKLMSQALCLLHPVTWPEPFGLVMIEAMACGCPVVAINKGAIPEIIRDGQTGFVVENINEMKNAVLNINKINRRTCRNYALVKFNDRLMGKRYEEMYFKILDDQVDAK